MKSVHIGGALCIILEHVYSKFQVAIIYFNPELF